MDHAIVAAEVARQIEDPQGSASPRAASACVPPGIPPANDIDRGRSEAEERPHRLNVPSGQFGIFSDVDEAVAAAAEAQQKLVALSLDDREAIVATIKQMAKENAAAWGRMELEETKIGRLAHKIEKLQALPLVPGVELLKTDAQSGSNGLCLEEFAPYGVIGILTPVTHSVPTLLGDAIMMIAAGNAVVAKPHRSGARCAAYAARECNKQIAARYGISHLISVIMPPTRQATQAIFAHPGVALLVVTGGPDVVEAALSAKKRAIIAGPGNPPVVVDETACLESAATSIVKGASYDNNVLCIGEKQVFAVRRVFDELLARVEKAGGYLLTASQIDALAAAAFLKDPITGEAHINKRLMGRDAAVLAEAAGVSVPPSTELLVGETGFDHPFVQNEQMMPFLPFVRVNDVDEAIDKAIKSEHGHRHTAIIHSRNIETVTRFAKLANTTLFVVNGPSLAGDGMAGGAGHMTVVIATPTGEGMTTPLTFTRYRRAVILGAMRII